MKNAIWKVLAFIVSRRRIAYWLIRRSMATPYFHLDGYMERWWLFNPYDGASGQQATSSDDSARHRARRWPWLPSVRIHHILRADNADHPHDHPWNARTIILDGGYFERRHAGAARIMRRGDTAPILYGDFHHIEHVTAGGVWTLFITWDYQGTWGFLVNGVKVPWREYEAKCPRHGEASVNGVADQEAPRPVVTREKQEIVNRLSRWAANIERVSNAMDGLCQAVGPTEGPLDYAIGRLTEAYTGLVAESVGAAPWPEGLDYANDLEWFKFECSLGLVGRAFECGGISGWVHDIESLADVIIAQQSNGSLADQRNDAPEVSRG